MFNISMSELLVILLVAFLVVGPKDMAKVAKGLGKAVKKGRDFLYDAKAYVNDAVEDTPIQDMKESVAKTKEKVEEMNPLTDVKKDIADTVAPVTEIKKDLRSLKVVGKGRSILK